jgi:capsular polysaccharide export protein
MLEAIPPVLYALGFSWRKRSLVRQFFGGHVGHGYGRCELRFVGSVTDVPDGATVAVWASGPFGCSMSLDAAGAPPEVRFTRLFVEDGFLRSVGLGADLVRPLSWVIDRRGIYFDASQPSDLEHALQTQVFEAAQLDRAARFRQNLVTSGLTKYNVGTQVWARPAPAGQKTVVLVAGQVETDASIRYGAPGIKTNLALLAAARQAHPDAWLVYKPHPDVVAGLRGTGAQETQAALGCNQIVTDVAMGALLDVVDVVHVMTSLAGFEALLRGKKVVCHGLPFYAGWGLTQDVLPMRRRTRKLSIDELVAGVLLEYPTYVSRATGQICPAEQALAELQEWRSGARAGLPLWRKILRPLIKRP